MDGPPVVLVLQHGRAWLSPVVRYRCGVVVNYNSATFSSSRKATNCTNTELNGKKGLPSGTPEQSASRYQKQQCMIIDFLGGKLMGQLIRSSRGNRGKSIEKYYRSAAHDWTHTCHFYISLILFFPVGTAHVVLSGKRRKE